MASSSNISTSDESKVSTSGRLKKSVGVGKSAGGRKKRSISSKSSKSPKIVKGDSVVVLSGKDVGAVGVVDRVIVKSNKVIVDNVNVAKRHQAPTRDMQQGGILDKAMPIDISNVALVSPTDGKATKIGYRFDANGNKVRICRRTKVDV